MCAKTAADFDDCWETFNTIYLRRIGQYGSPPRTTIEAGRLCCEEFRIEIAAIAHVRTSSPLRASLRCGERSGEADPASIRMAPLRCVANMS